MLRCSSRPWGNTFAVSSLIATQDSPYHTHIDVVLRRTKRAGGAADAVWRDGLSAVDFLAQTRRAV